MKIGLLARSSMLILAAAVVTGACSSDSDPLTLEEYIAEFEAIDIEVDSQIEALFADFPDDEEELTDEANLEYFKDIVAGFPRIVGDAIDSTKDLDPPPELEAAHDELIETGEDVVDAFEEAAEIMDEAETMAELEERNAEFEPAIDRAEAAFDAACLAIVDIAIANDIDVSVTCEDE